MALYLEGVESVFSSSALVSSPPALVMVISGHGSRSVLGVWSSAHIWLSSPVLFHVKHSPWFRGGVG